MPGPLLLQAFPVTVLLLESSKSTPELLLLQVLPVTALLLLEDLK